MNIIWYQFFTQAVRSYISCRVTLLRWLMQMSLHEPLKPPMWYIMCLSSLFINSNSTSITSFLVFRQPAYATLTRKFESFSSSAGENSWSGPGLSPWVRFPEVQWRSVNFNTLCNLAAHEIGAFSSVTNFITAPIASLVHCYLFLPCFSTTMVTGAHIGRGLPHIFWCLGSSSLSRVLEWELMVAVFGKVSDTISNITARQDQTTIILAIITYHIAGKFGGEKVWRIDSFQAFGERKFGELIDQPIGYQL